MNNHTSSANSTATNQNVWSRVRAAVSTPNVTTTTPRVDDPLSILLETSARNRDAARQRAEAFRIAATAEVQPVIARHRNASGAESFPLDNLSARDRPPSTESSRTSRYTSSPPRYRTWCSEDSAAYPPEYRTWYSDEPVDYPPIHTSRSEDSPAADDTFEPYTTVSLKTGIMRTQLRPRSVPPQRGDIPTQPGVTFSSSRVDLAAQGSSTPYINSTKELPPPSTPTPPTAAQQEHTSGLACFSGPKQIRKAQELRGNLHRAQRQNSTTSTQHSASSTPDNSPYRTNSLPASRRDQDTMSVKSQISGPTPLQPRRHNSAPLPSTSTTSWSSTD